jgi:hypothetical protein
MATLSNVLGQIRTNESGGNYTAQNPTSTASGAYQFVNGTWQGLTQQSGIGTQYPTAKSAPPNVQDAVAAYALERNPNANSSSLWGGGPHSYPLVDSYDVSSQSLAAGNSLGGGGVLGNYAGSQGGFGANGTYADGTPIYDPNLGVVAPNTGAQDPYSGAPAYDPYSGASSPYAMPGNAAQNAAAGAAAGSGAGFPLTVGLQAGIGSAIGTWLTGWETDISNWIKGLQSAVGTWMTNAATAAFSSLKNWFARGAVMILAVVLIAIALWRLLDPSGEKTEAVARYAAAA